MGLLIAALLGAVTLAAQDPKEIIRRTAETYKSAKSYKLEGTDTLEQNIRGRERTTRRQFKAFRQQPDAMRVEFADGGIRLTDGHSEWNYSPQTKQYTKKAVPWDSRGRRGVSEFFYNYEGIADFVKSADFVGPPGKDGYVIEVTYELPGNIASEEIKTYWIDAARHVVLREISHPATIVEPPAVGPVRFTRTIAFLNVELNPTLAPSLFTPPPDRPALSGIAPDFTLADLAGAPVELRDLRGRPVVLYFWATWCATCREEMPKVEALARDHPSSDLVVLGINDEDPDIAADYLKSGGHSIRSLVDRWQEVHKKFAIPAVPAVVVIAKDGRIASVTGFGEDDAMRSGLRRAGVE